MVYCNGTFFSLYNLPNILIMGRTKADHQKLLSRYLPDNKITTSSVPTKVSHFVIFCVPFKVWLEEGNSLPCCLASMCVCVNFVQETNCLNERQI